MKRILILLFIFCFVSPLLIAQHRLKNSEIPKNVIKNFSDKFPTYKKVIWRKIDILYEAEVFVEKKVSFATFDTAGIWIETLTEIEISELPAEVVTGVHKMFSSAIIKAAAKIEQSINVDLYIVQFRFKGKKGELTLDKTGVQK